MANDTIKRLQSAATPGAAVAGVTISKAAAWCDTFLERKAVQSIEASNVFAFPARPAMASAKPCRKYREAKRANVLAFTGKRIRNIDGPACLPDWKKIMVDQLTKAIDQVLRDEVTGLMLTTTSKFPTNEDNPTGRTILCGTYNVDLQLAVTQAEWIAEKAHEMKEHSPIRWV